ncbi:exodeoxyribonuclease III [Maritalea myrionectae]|uniref:exodeoxyribonuclease III n=1 Tax=Maritalea myrionectae TaxID=454601 RepID=UPI000E3DD8F3|nr:exodeoxyribonuclease III [Maritalea myrionectae]
MKIATWNINGIKARLNEVLYWLEEYKPDLVALQEIKSIDENFPREAIEELGYNVATHGQKSFNGVALLSLHPFDEVNRGLPGDDSDEQARFIETVISRPGGAVRVAGIYLPNGNPVDTEKFPYKLAWMDRLIDWAEDRLKLEEPFIILGDYNIIPTGADTHSAEAWWGDALFRPESLERFRSLSNLGFTDGLRAVNGDEAYTFWDFQAGAWRRNNGIRIDHLMLSPQAADILETVEIHKDMRAREKPSDHVPVVGSFAI